MDGFTQHLYYLPIDPAIEAGYVRLRERLQEITDEKNRIICCFIWLYALLWGDSFAFEERILIADAPGLL